MDFPRNLFIETAKNEGHSDRYLSNTLTYVDKLTSKKLPVVFSLNHLAVLLGMELSDLVNLISHRNELYSFYLIKKRRGGFRRIVAPYRDLKFIQSWLKENILDMLPLSAQATGFVKGKSILNNAKIHENSEAILNLDLSNFFESITEKRVYGIFHSMGYAKNLSVELARICTAKLSQEKYESMEQKKKEYFNELYKLEEAVLVQGAPTSPSISNLVCRRLDLRLSTLANKLGVNYSRYADDITFSGSEDKLPGVRLLKNILEDEGFKINWDKLGKFKKGQRQVVTGLLINNRVRIPKKFKKEIYRHLHFCVKFGAYSHFDRINPGKGYKKEWLLGKIKFVYSIEPDEAKKMFNLVDIIDWGI